MSKKISLPPETKVPNHLAIIPDGNRRWAMERGLPTFEGHRRGFEVGIKITQACRNFGVHTLTFWAFSTENWERSKEEVSYLMGLYHRFIDQYLEEAKKNGVRIIHLGRKERIEKNLFKKLKKAEEETKNNKKYIFNFALDYGGQDEILRAVDKLRLNTKFQVPNTKLTKEFFESFLDTAGQPYPYPDLMIRTSGELRTSGLLLWQSAYTEFYFEKDYFPDLTPEHIKKAILAYSQRQRRFGG